MMERFWWLIIPAVVIGAGIALIIAIALVWALPWWGFMSAFMIIGFAVLWLGVGYDLFRRADMSLWARVAWAVFVVVLPVFGAIAYYFSRPPATEIRYRGEQVA